MLRQNTARENAKMDARKRVFTWLYVEFDNLPPACREAHRQLPGWQVWQLRKCSGNVCNHNQPHLGDR